MLPETIFYTRPQVFIVTFYNINVSENKNEDRAIALYSHITREAAEVIEERLAGSAVRSWNAIGCGSEGSYSVLEDPQRLLGRRHAGRP